MADRRIALVADGASALGQTIAARLAESGHVVLAGDVVEGAVPDIVPLALDPTDEAGVARAFAEIEARFGRLDVLVNDRIVPGETARIENGRAAAWEEAIRGNLTSAFLMSRAALPMMRRQGGGRIVNIASGAARGAAPPGTGAYAAASAGLIGFTRALAEEAGACGVSVNCLAPSFEPDRHGDIANVVAWLCSERAGFVTGTVLDVNGGGWAR
ncbi:MAG: SDR family oxidoreductase [Sphingomonas bacterium]